MDTIYRKHLSWVMMAVPAILIIGVALWAEKMQKESDQANYRWGVYKNVLNASGVAIVLVNEKGTIVEWNEGARRIFGYGSDEIIGRELEALMPDYVKERHRKAFRKAVDSEMVGDDKLYVINCMAKKKNGDETPVVITLRMVNPHTFSASSKFIAVISRGKLAVVETPKEVAVPKDFGDKKEEPSNKVLGKEG